MVYLLGRTLPKLMYHLGYFIGKHPSHFLTIPLLVCLLCATGLQNAKTQNNADQLYLPGDGRFADAKASLNELYPMNYSTIFSKERLIERSRFGRLIVTAKDNATLFREQIFWEIVLLDRIIRNLTIDYDDYQLTFGDDLCAKLNDQCFNSNTILDLAYQIKEIESNRTRIGYPIWLNPDTNVTYYFHNQIGGLTLAKDSTVLAVQAIQLNYYLDLSIKYGNDLAALFEQKFVDIIRSLEDQFDYLTLAPYASFSTTQELDQNLQQFVSRFSLTFALMLVYGFFSSLMFDCVTSKPWWILGASITPLLALMAAFGLCSYVGIEMITLNWLVLYVVLGNTMQDAFLVLSVYRRTLVHLTVRERLAETYSEAMSSITINVFTNCSFYTASYFLTSYKAIQIFSIYIGVSLACVYVVQLTMFGGLLALFGYIEGKNLHSLICVPIISKSSAANKKWIFRLFCTGGINQKDPENELDNRAHSLMLFFRDIFAKLINNPFMRLVILLAFLVHLSIGIYSLGQLNEAKEFDRTSLFSERSYARKFADFDQKYFLDNKYAVQIIFNETLDYSNTFDQYQLEQLIGKIESSDYMDRQSTQCWFRSYLRFVQIIRQQRNRPFQLNSYNLTQKDGFYNLLKDVFLPLPSNFIYRSDIVFNTNLTEIISSRCIVFSGHLANSTDEKKMLERLHRIADSSKLNITFYHHNFGQLEQFAQVKELVVNFFVLLIVVLVVNCVLFMPTLSSLFWLILVAISIELGFISYLIHWNLNLDFISAFVLLVSLAFSTNSVVHVACAYFESANFSVKKRIRNTLFTVGFPLLSGYLLKLLIVASVSLPTNSSESISYIYLAFGKSALILLALAAFTELFLLPVLLSLGSSLCRKPTYTSSSDKHLSELSDLDSEDAESDDDFFYRRSHKSYYKCANRERLVHEQPPFYYTEKWFDGRNLTVGPNRCATVTIPRLLMKQPKGGDKLLNENINFLTGNRLSAINARTMNNGQFDPQKSQPTIWANDEDIRNDVISKFNKHWEHLNEDFRSKGVRSTTDHLAGQLPGALSKPQAGLQANPQSTESSDLGLGTSGDSEQNSEGSWKLNSEKPSNKKTNRNNGALKSPESNYRLVSNFNAANKTAQQFTHFRPNCQPPLPPLPPEHGGQPKETKYNTFYQSGKDKPSKHSDSAFRKSKSLKKPSGIPGANSIFSNYNQKKPDQDWIN